MRVFKKDYYEDFVTFPPFDHPLGMEHSGKSYSSKSYCMERKQTRLTVCEYVISGSGHIREDNREFDVCPGDIYILHRGHDHRYFTTSDEPWVKLWFNLRGSFPHQILMHYGLSNVNLIKGCAIEHLFEKYVDTVNSDEPIADIFDSCTLIFLDIVQHISNHQKNIAKPENMLAHKLKELIDNDFSFTCGLGEYIEKLYCTKSHAIRCFKESYNTTPYQYILNKKILTAQTLLTNTTMTIQEISYILKFSDNHYFSTLFKSKTGKSPKEYRNKH